MTVSLAHWEASSCQSCCKHSRCAACVSLMVSVTTVGAAITVGGITAESGSAGGGSTAEPAERGCAVDTGTATGTDFDAGMLDCLSTAESASDLDC